MKISNIYVAGAIAGLFTSGVAHADATWQMWDKTSPVACSQTNAGTTVNTVSNTGNTYGCSAVSASDPTMTVTAWSTNGAGSTFANASVRRWDWTSTPSTPITIAGQTSGYDYGVVNSSGIDSTSPQHSMDNSTYTDLIALDFGTKQVALTQVSLGWISGDADVSILRYTGNAANLSAAISGKTLSGLTSVSGGWELVGHYKDLQNDVAAPARTAEISNSGSSSWWLVSAYSSAYGTGTTDHGGVTSSTYSDTKYDYMKLLQVAGTVAPAGCTSNCGGGSVPEPGGLALVGLGFAGMIFSRRKAKLAA